jgi:hypothetical protein
LIIVGLINYLKILHINIRFFLWFAEVVIHRIPGNAVQPCLDLRVIL